MSRAKGYKCYNSICRSCVGTFCNEPGDNALYCTGRSANCRTNADRIRAMSDEELVEADRDGRVKIEPKARKCPKCGKHMLFPRIDWKYYYCFACKTQFPASEINTTP